MTVQGHSYDDNVGAPVNRNLIINGGMQVAQRGTSTASITTIGYYTADRWTTNSMNSLFGTWTQSVENDAPTGSGHRKSLKMLITAGAGTPGASTSTWVGQSIEGQNIQHIAKGTSSAKQLTVQFWVKANVTGTYIFELYDVDNTRQVSGSYTILASATWEKKTIIIPLDTTGAFDNDNNNSMVCIFHLAAGTTYTSGTLNTTWGSVVLANRAVGQTNLAAATSNYWQVTGVQLEVGSVATPFEFEPFETTLGKCMRYFQKSCADGVSLGRSDADSARHSGWIMGTGSTTVGGGINVFHTVPLRATPIVSFAAWDTGPTTVAINGTFTIHFNGQGNGTGYYVYSNNRKFTVTTNAVNGLCFFTYEANAEL